MSRKVLLIEPNYKNKYPPMGLMKLATYFRSVGDDVFFFKGDLRYFAAKLLCEEFLETARNPKLGKYVPNLINFIRNGSVSNIELIPDFINSKHYIDLLHYRSRFRSKQFLKFDIVAVTTLFTFYWDLTIETINYSKLFCKEDGRIIVGGIASSILEREFTAQTNISPICGLLNRAGIIDDNELIIDNLPLDYSILEEIDYVYPANNSYFSYMTRGCPRKCSFCAVPLLEPGYNDYISIIDQVKTSRRMYGDKKDLLLLDNNVFASDQFEKIIDEIKECGFIKGAKYTKSNEYDITLNNLRKKNNTRAYKNKMIKIYDHISDKLIGEEQGVFYLEREKRNLLYSEFCNIEDIIEFDKIARPLYLKYNKKTKSNRYVDFNQGIDARLVTEEKIKKLSEICIKPLRIAFDHYSMKDIYEYAVRTSAKYGIRDLSNYLLYNFEDKPEELYYRLKLNVELSNELDVRIYSFPMKYHPLNSEEYFHNRDYIGKYWNKKFIRSIQSILNSTKGKVGTGKSFFYEAFGADIDEYMKILWMPENFIIYRSKYRDNLAKEWWELFSSLEDKKLQMLKRCVAANKFDTTRMVTGDLEVNKVLSYYFIK